MGMIIGGVVAAVVIGVGVYMFVGGNKQPASTSEQPATTTTASQPTSSSPSTTTPAVQPPPPVVQTGPSPDEKKATEMIQLAMKTAAKGDYDGGRKKLNDAESFVKSKNLNSSFLGTIQTDRTQIDKVQSNKELAAALKQSNDLFDTANGAITAGQWDKASQALDQLQGLGEGAAHKDEIPNLRNQIEGGKKLDAQFAQAQSQANSNDEGTLISAKATMDAIANANGRHSAEARNAARTLETKINNLKAEAQRTAVAQQAKEKAEKVSELKGEINRLLGANDFAGAKSKVPELKGLGEETGPVLAEIENAEKRFQASQRSAECQVVLGAKEPWTGPAPAAGTMLNPAFLDAAPQFSHGANCGLPGDVLQAGQKNSETRVEVQVDTNGSVTEGGAVAGFPSPPPGLISAAKSAWHFSPPTVKGRPIKTKIVVAVHFK